MKLHAAVHPFPLEHRMIGDIHLTRVMSAGHSGLTAFVEAGISGRRYLAIGCRSNNDFSLP